MQDACSRLQAAPLVSSAQMKSPVRLFLVDMLVDLTIRDVLFVSRLTFLALHFLLAYVLHRHCIEAQIFL